jgi:hypothetical protein
MSFSVLLIEKLYSYFKVFTINFAVFES